MFLFEVTRNPATLLTALEAGPIKKALMDAGHDFVLPCGAVMFVPAEQYLSIRLHMRRQDLDLQRRHIIATHELDAAVRAIIEAVPKKEKVKIKSCTAIRNEQHPAMSVKNTFVHVHMPPSTQSSPSATAVSDAQADPRNKCKLVKSRRSN